MNKQCVLWIIPSSIYVYHSSYKIEHIFVLVSLASVCGSLAGSSRGTTMTISWKEKTESNIKQFTKTGRPIQDLLYVWEKLQSNNLKMYLFLRNFHRQVHISVDNKQNAESLSCLPNARILIWWQPGGLLEAWRQFLPRGPRVSPWRCLRLADQIFLPQRACHGSLEWKCLIILDNNT